MNIKTTLLLIHILINNIEINVLNFFHKNIHLYKAEVIFQNFYIYTNFRKFK